MYLTLIVEKELNECFYIDFIILSQVNYFEKKIKKFLFLHKTHQQTTRFILQF